VPVCLAQPRRRTDRPWPPPADRSRAQRVWAIQASQTLERHYAPLRARTIRSIATKLRASNVSFDPADLDAHYNHAWHALHAKLVTGCPVDNLGGFLTQAAYFRAIDCSRKEHLDRRVDALDTAVSDRDLDGALDDAERLRAFMEGLRARLRGRDLSAAALCYLHGYSRTDAAEVLGITPGQMKRVMDHVSRQVAILVSTLQAGDRCDGQRSLVTAYALRVLDPQGARIGLARAHLAECSACRARVRTLRAGTPVGA
jgi:DNA-directed RNA polymerase specialized sigma24 family protein